jgi:hypothetical protein
MRRRKTCSRRHADSHALPRQWGRGQVGALALVAMALLAAAAPAADDPAPAAAGLGAVAFLAGVWQHEEDGRFREETWTAPRGDLMLGTNRTVRSGKKTQWEQLRLVAEDGEVTYWASPSGAPPTPFRLVEHAANRAVFANPEHDFPQRLTYVRDGDRLSVRVEAQKDGEWDGFELHWTLAAQMP